jgi:hypothetical protein
MARTEGARTTHDSSQIRSTTDEEETLALNGWKNLGITKS